MSINDVLEMDLMPIILVVGIVAAIFAVRYMVERHKIEVNNATSPVRQIHVRIIDKVYASSGRFDTRGQVICQLDNGERMTLYLTRETLLNYAIGDEGVLHMQGSKILHFSRGAICKTNSQSANKGSMDPQYVPAWKRVQMAKEKEDASNDT